MAERLEVGRTLADFCRPDLRDLGLDSVAICGIAIEIGIEPTCRHATDLGFVPMMIRGACGAGHPEAGERSLASLGFMGDAILADRSEVMAAMGRHGHG